MMKDELDGKTMTEFVALRKKCMRIERQPESWKTIAAKAQRSVKSLKALLLMAAKHAYLRVKQYKES